MNPTGDLSTFLGAMNSYEIDGPALRLRALRAIEEARLLGALHRAALVAREQQRERHEIAIARVGGGDASDLWL